MTEAHLDQHYCTAETVSTISISWVSWIVHKDMNLYEGNVRFSVLAFIVFIKIM